MRYKFPLCGLCGLAVKIFPFAFSCEDFLCLRILLNPGQDVCRTRSHHLADNPNPHRNRPLACSQNVSAKRCSGWPPISSATARSAPSCGFCESCSGLNVNRADVINNVLPSLPPKVQEVGLLTGKRNTLSTFPSGVIRRTQLPPNRAFQRQPS